MLGSPTKNCVTANKTPYNYLQFLDKVCGAMISAQNYIDHEYPEGEVIVEERRVISSMRCKYFQTIRLLQPLAYVL